MSVATLDTAPARRRLRIGFAGLGWIGQQRMLVLAQSGLVDVAAVCDPDEGRRSAVCAELDTRPVECASFDGLLDETLDGIVIATPNACHEAQVEAALLRGIPVFCQKPLALSAQRTRQLVDLAKRQGVPLGVDWSYRYLAGASELRARIADGALGRILAAEACFHNAYGPGAAWYYDRASAGGGCLIDLGSHLLDLCHWLVGLRNPRVVTSRCFREGRLLAPPVNETEDFATALVACDDGPQVHLGCSWRASTGEDATIACRVYGSAGGAEIRNVGGSFFDFEVALLQGRQRELLSAPPDPWPGRALLDWANRVATAAGVAPDVDDLVTTAVLIDAIYGRVPAPRAVRTTSP